MNLRSQSGVTLIELVIALAISGSVMIALTSVVMGANLLGNTWGQRTFVAQAAQMLPNQLQSDAHRYVPCSGARGGQDLHLCLPAGTEMVSYTVQGGCPCDLVRTDRVLGSTTVVVRNMPSPPSFTTACSVQGAVDQGSITVALTYAGDFHPEVPVVVYFRAPAGTCGP